MGEPHIGEIGVLKIGQDYNVQKIIIPISAPIIKYFMPGSYESALLTVLSTALYLHDVFVKFGGFISGQSFLLIIVS